jgi:hypothetical protein
MTEETKPDPLAEEAREHARRILRPVFEGRRLLLVGGPLTGLAKSAKALADLGVASFFLLGDGPGTGDPPDPALGPAVALPSGGADIVDAMRRAEARLLDLPPEVRAAVDRWDPDGRALAFVSFTMTRVDAVAGRRRFAPRPPEWEALEDKVAIDAFWDAAGVRRAPSAIVAADGDSLREAARRLDRGLGTAWAGDAREGVHGGAVCVRRVRTEEDAAEAAAFLAARCDRARVMPFLEGIPCSIHGLVFPGGRTAVFRPVEMVTLRRPGSGRLLYAGAASYFDPAAEDREAMRALARRVGAALHARLGYRGGFTVDGVLAEEGFLPTELNARLGAGHNLLASSSPGLPFVPLAIAAAAGLDLDFRPDLLEEAVTAAADRVRQGGAWASTEAPRAETAKAAFVDEAGTLRPAREGEAPDATAETGPGAVGSFVRILPAPGRLAPGPSVAPWAVRALAAADRHLGTGFGPLEAARDVRGQRTPARGAPSGSVATPGSP